MVVAYAGPLSQVPDGWLPCDGRALKSTDFPTLYDRIGTTYGNGSAGMGAGSGTNFNAPDLRAEFIRGLDRGRGVDANRTVGSFQNWATASPANKLLVTLQSVGSHTHSFASINASGAGSGYATIHPVGNVGHSFIHYAGGTVIPGNVQTAGAHTHTVSVAGGGDAETRPVNTAVHYFIKY
jgi:microcystin-dependent protein